VTAVPLPRPGGATPAAGPGTAVEGSRRPVAARLAAAAVHPVTGWSLAGVGFLALLLGWLGVSGSPIPAKQLPYLVSGGMGGLALVLLGAAVLSAADTRRQLERVERLERMVLDLHDALLEPVPAPPVVATSPDVAPALPSALVALPAGRSYHRADCALVAGKPVARLRRGEAARRGLNPCRVCDPPPAP